MSSASSSSEERVLILAPLGRDGAIAGSALSKVGKQSIQIAGVAEHGFAGLLATLAES